jgi:hypothetical protein
MTDPIRLRDPRAGASPELRDLIAAGRSELPDAKRLSAIAGRLALVSPLPLRVDALAHGLSKWLGTWAGKVGVAAMLVGIGTAVVAVRAHPAPSAPEAPPIGFHPVQGTVATPRSIAAAAPETSNTTTPDLPPPVASTAGPSRRGQLRASTRTASTASASSTTESEVPAAHPPGWVPSTWGSSMAPAAVAPAPDDPSLALDLALRDERSSGRLSEQRDFVIIEALVRLGRMAEARERAARFLRIFPGSARRRVVTELVGFDPGSQNQ